MAQRLLHRLLLTIFLTIPMAQRLLHRLLLSIFFDNPNGTATVTQTFFGNFFWQSQWHSDCYTDFFWQSAELRFSYQVCGKGRPSDQTWRPQFFYFHSRSKNPATANITPRKAAFQKLILQGCGTNIAEYDTSHQNIAGTQGNYEKTKNAEEHAKATKYCAQQQKWYMNYCRIWWKSSKYCRDTR